MINLNLFAASGHISYAKSARFYVQQMQELYVSHPWLHHQFVTGLHAVRRGDRYWSGLWSDLTIEQTLMRSVKSQGGLTRGRGMSESVRHLWVLSLSQCAGVHNAMMDLSGLTVKTSEQHTDASEPRRKRDVEDFTRFKSWLKERNPFTFTNPNLQSLSAGWISITGKDKVNCDEAESIGEAIQHTLDGLTLATCKYQT